MFVTKRMTLHNQFVRMTVVAALLLCVVFLLKSPVRAEVAQSPLFLTMDVPANIMLMLDNSGSMLNVVPDLPYDAAETYLCSGATVWDAANQVDIYIMSAGVPYLRDYGTPDYYDWGTGTGIGATGREKRCFDENLSYKARLYGDSDSGTASSDKSPGSYLPAEYSGNYLNWYFGYNNTVADTPPTFAVSFGSQARIKPLVKTRMEIAKNAGHSLIDQLGSDLRVGLSTYNSGNGGSLLATVGDLDDAKRVSLKTALDELSAAGATPLAETLSDIGYYFSRGATDLVLHPGTPSVTRGNVFSTNYSRHSNWDIGSNPIEYTCQQSFAILMTDGRPQNDRDVSSYLRDYTGDCSVKNLCTAGDPGYGMKAGRDYETSGSDYLDDVAMALFNMDLRPDLSDLNGVKNNLRTYMVGFADDQVINDPLIKDTASRGGGEFLVAGNEDELITSFQKILGDIIVRSKSSAAAIATNSTRLIEGTLIYQARFDPKDWSGQLRAYKIAMDGTVSCDIEWATSDIPLDEAAEEGCPAFDSEGGSFPPDISTRKVFTYTPENTIGESAGIPFKDDDSSWNSLSTAQKDALIRSDDETVGKQRLNWIRGENISGMRARPVTILGDIINSDPLVVGIPNFGYDQLAGTGLDAERDSYTVYRQGLSGRTRVLYVGANDGMLHAFDASTGDNMFSYVPRGVYSKLADLTDPNYIHQYYVDGSPAVGDAYINITVGGVTQWQWRTILASGLGAGGRSVFALDVTAPASFDEDNVLWEFPYSDIANTDVDLADIGYTFGQPVIARMQNGQYAAIFGNGYGSDSHKAQLFIVNVEDGTLIRKIDTGAPLPVGSRNGLSAVSLVQSGNIVTTAYAGDLLGNLWKFDLSSANPADWRVAYAGSPLFIAKDNAGQRQPITAPLEIGRHFNGRAGHMIYFGTGKYFETDDSSDKSVQSFYGIWDSGTEIAQTDRTNNQFKLKKQQILAEGSTVGVDSETTNWRIVSSSLMNWNQDRGWLIDLVSPVDGVQGERVVSSPVLRRGRVIFTTLIPPTGNVCAIDGTSWLMELDQESGGRLSYSVLDVNRDRSIDDGDLVKLIDAQGNIVTDNKGNPIMVPVSGKQSTVGIIKTPAIIEAGELEFKYFGGSEGGIEVVTEAGGEAGDLGRRSWRQLQ